MFIRWVMGAGCWVWDVPSRTSGTVARTSGTVARTSATVGRIFFHRCTDYNFTESLKRLYVACWVLGVGCWVCLRCFDSSIDSLTVNSATTGSVTGGSATADSITTSGTVAKTSGTFGRIFFTDAQIITLFVESLNC
jgi:hypothetical protein